METLKNYEPSDKGRELIAVLFPLSHENREKNILAYWKRYPQEINAVLDGFHYMLQELIEARNSGNNEETLNLSDELLFAIFKQMYEEKIFFAYDSDSGFMDAVNSFQPAIFAKPEELDLFLKNASEAAQRSLNSNSESSEEISDSVLKKVTDLCTAVEGAYEEVLRVVPSMRRSKKVIEELKGTADQLDLIDLNLAKETYTESIQTFKKQAKVISDGLGFISEVHQKHKNHLLILAIYSKYLAKVLASRESFQPIERYVLRLANGNFVQKEPDFESSDEQLQQGITNKWLRKEYRSRILKTISRLECRYHKRKLMVRLKEGTQKLDIIKELIKTVETDPEDIKTVILLARMLAEHFKKIRDPQKRKYTKEQALRYCNLAMGKIDDYLSLQGYKKVRERDVQRAGFLKTISAIRLPLIRKGK